MTLHLDYIKDTKGRTKSVVIPNREWEYFRSEYDKMKSKLSILLGIKIAMKEMREIQSGKRKAKFFSEFLDEL